MTAATSTTDSDEAKKTPEGVSAFVAKVLDQLSLTAWLPASMLIGVTALLAQLGGDKTLDVPAAVQRLATQPWGTTIVLLFGLLLTTMVTQAFAFEAIRLLEGYWGGNRFTDWAVSRGVARQAKRRQTLGDRAVALEKSAFESARSLLLSTEDREHVEILEDQVYRVPKAKRRDHDPQVVRDARAINWRSKADPRLIALLERSYMRLKDYPEQPHRLLPTPLGNVLRSAEDRLGVEGAALEGFVMRNYAVIPTRLMTQHDQFRNRLEMYGTLVPVFLFLGGASVFLLWSTDPDVWVPAVSAVLFLFLALVSYRAAVTSARGYGSVLALIAVYATEQRPSRLGDSG